MISRKADRALAGTVLGTGFAGAVESAAKLIDPANRMATAKNNISDRIAFVLSTHGWMIGHYP